MIDQTHDPQLQSWVPGASDSAGLFPIQNLPYATYRLRGEEGMRTGVRIGEFLLDVGAALGLPGLKMIMGLAKSDRAEFRHRLSRFLSEYESGADRYLVPLVDTDLHVPVEIGDYTDFYASVDHATNVGRMFRPERPLFPNYKWVPIAYHGRASSVMVSGTAVRRPHGQVGMSADGPARFAISARLDYEAEIGAFLAMGNQPGEAIPIERAGDHLFGVCLLNDWSARDVQAWEYQPLGPFLAKNFATSVSPYVITAEALEPFRVVAAPRGEGDPPPLEYLREEQPGAYRIQVEVWLRTPRMAEPVRLSEGDFARMYWTFAQMVTHHASNGCRLRPGDLIGSGTISGPEKRNRGCLLEMTLGGKEPLALPNGETRTFLEDGDEVILRGFCELEGFRRIGLGECGGVVLPAAG